MSKQLRWTAWIKRNTWTKAHAVNSVPGGGGLAMCGRKVPASGRVSDWRSQRRRPPDACRGCDRMWRLGGRCYELAGRQVLDGSQEHGPVLVHGIVTGTGGPVSGLRYGHAWVEYGSGLTVWDPETGNVALSVTFYAIGLIDRSECRRYTADHARAQVLEYEHWGPWDSPA